MTYKEPCTFQRFSTYCQQLQNVLNQLPNYSSKYIIKQGKFITEHDAEYLEILYSHQNHQIKINLVFNYAYKIPDFMFMIYEDGRPLNSDQTYKRMKTKNGSSVQQLKPGNEYGIILVQNHISGNTFFTLHGCQISRQIQYLVPFYLSLIGLHPIIDFEKSKQISE